MAIWTLRAFALAAALGPGAVACTESGQPGSASGQFDDEQLEAFVVAEAEVRAIQEDYTERLENAGSDEDPAALQSDAHMEMQRAVEEAGLSPREYTEIAQAADRDPEFRQELRELAE